MAKAAVSLMNKKILAAHKALSMGLDELEKLVESGRAAETELFRKRLSLIRKELAAHFKFEENGGYMAAILDRAPQFQSRVSKLLNQHRTITASLDKLLDAVQTGEAKVLKSSLRKDLERWLRRLREHESDENQLIMEVFNYDLWPED